MKMGVILADSARNQRGMALISALLLLLVISLLAVGLSMDTSMDVRGAAYQRFKARAFASTEAGLMAATDILEENFHGSGEWVQAVPFEFPRLSDDYVGSINILRAGGLCCGPEDKTLAAAMTMTGDIEAQISIEYLDTVMNEGAGLQVAAGYGGAGKSASEGGTAALLNIEATGRDADFGNEQASTNLALNYRHVN